MSTTTSHSRLGPRALLSPNRRTGGCSPFERSAETLKGSGPPSRAVVLLLGESRSYPEDPDGKLQPVHLGASVVVVELGALLRIHELAVLVGVENAFEVELRDPLVIGRSEGLCVVRADALLVASPGGLGSGESLRLVAASSSAGVTIVGLRRLKRNLMLYCLLVGVLREERLCRGVTRRSRPSGRCGRSGPSLRPRPRTLPACRVGWCGSPRRGWR